MAANLYAAWRALKPSPTETAAGALSKLYRAEMGKLIMIGALFVAVFTGWEEVNVVAFLTGSMIAVIAGAAGPFFQRIDWNTPK